MDTITIKLAEAADFSATAPLLFPAAQPLLRQAGILLLAYPAEGTKPMGALGALQQADGLQVISLFVKEEARHGGIGSALASRAEALAQERGLAQIAFVYACAPAQAPLLDAFFLKNGYPLPKAGETMFTLALTELKKSAFFSLMQHAKPSTHILPLRQIEKSLLAPLPPQLTPDAAAGILLPELCLGYVQQNHLTAMLVMSDTDGILHLHSAYLAEKQNAAHLMALLRQALETVQQKYPTYQQLTITSGSQSGYQLIQKLLLGAEKSRSITYTAAKPLAPFYFLLPDFAATLSRLQSYADSLARQGIATELTLPNGGAPYLELPCGAAPLSLSYQIAEAKAEMQFTLFAEYAFPPLDEAPQSRILARLQAADAPYLALRTAEGNLRLQGSFAEGKDSDGFAPKRSITEFILPLLAYLEGLQQELS